MYYFVYLSVGTHTERYRDIAQQSVGTVMRGGIKALLCSVVCGNV
jgi:hypothetical protein